MFPAPGWTSMLYRPTLRDHLAVRHGYYLPALNEVRLQVLLDLHWMEHYGSGGLSLQHSYNDWSFGMNSLLLIHEGLADIT